MAKREMFSVVIEYPRSVSVGSIVYFGGKRIEVTKIMDVAPVTEKVIVINGFGKQIPYSSFMWG